MTLYKEIDELLEALGISTKSSNPNFFIYRIEDYFGREPIVFGPYRYDFFELTFGTGHDVDIKIGNTGFKPIEDSLSFTSPFQLSSWQVNAFRKDSLGYMIFFKYELLGEHLDKIAFHRRYPFFNLHSSPVLFLNETQRTSVIGIMKTLLKEFQNNIPDNEIIIRSYLIILLEKVKEFYGDASVLNRFTSRAEEITFLFENAVKVQNNYKLKIADYASQLHLSSAYLSEAVKSATQKTPHAIIREYLILQAKSLLNQTDKTIAVIAEDLGFEEASNFVKYFKKAVGITPHRFRRKP